MFENQQYLFLSCHNLTLMLHNNQISLVLRKGAILGICRLCVPVERGSATRGVVYFYGIIFLLFKGNNNFRRFGRKRRPLLGFYY